MFLERLSKYYELIIYTASLSKYADPLLDVLDPNKVSKDLIFFFIWSFLVHNYLLYNVFTYIIFFYLSKLLFLSFISIYLAVYFASIVNIIKVTM